MLGYILFYFFLALLIVFVVIPLVVFAIYSEIKRREK